MPDIFAQFLKKLELMTEIYVSAQYKVSLKYLQWETRWHMRIDEQANKQRNHQPDTISVEENAFKEI